MGGTAGETVTLTNGVTRTDWIEIDAKPVSSRFVAMAYFESTDAPPGSVVTPTPFVSPSPSGPAAQALRAAA